MHATVGVRNCAWLVLGLEQGLPTAAVGETRYLALMIPSFLRVLPTLEPSKHRRPWDRQRVVAAGTFIFGDCKGKFFLAACCVCAVHQTLLL